MIFTEKIQNFVKITNDQAQLLAGSVVKVGGRFFNLTSALTLNRTVSGLGGIDFGSIAVSTFYYVYVVQSGGVAYLIASTSAQNPIGYSSHRKIGAFYTDTSGNIFKVYSLGEINSTVFTALLNSTGNVVSSPSSTWISSAAGFTITPVAGIFSLTPNGWGVSTQVGVDTFASRSVNYIQASSTPTSIVFQMVNGAGGTTNDSASSIGVQKRGVDAVQPIWTLY